MLLNQVSLAFGIFCFTVSCQTPDSSVEIRPGIDVLLDDSVHLVSHGRVGLLTNQTGIDKNGIDDVTRLVEAGVQLTALFSPEHGFRGVLDQANVGHSTDSVTGLPIYSLYGAVRAPTATMLELIDVLLVDLQDIGSRTYTYISTTILAMEAATGSGVSVVILDRPNPIGALVQGPTLDPRFTSMVGMLPVPLRHGMTIGELALFANAVRNIGAMVTVVPVAGWERSTWFDETGLPWIRPSPNMPSVESAAHYPGMVLFEATNLSVGRGTPIAFQVLGAPWLDPAPIVENLADHPGVRVSDTTITPVGPTDGKYDGQVLAALRFRVIDRRVYDPVRLAADLFGVMRRLQGDSLTIRAETMDRLAGTDEMRTGGWTPSGMASWDGSIEAFLLRRSPFLIY